MPLGSVELIFNEKLLKGRIYESVNSTQMHCLLWKSQQMRAKKKRENAEEDVVVVSWIQTDT